MSTFLVTNNKDSGAGSLRQAIEDANQNQGNDTIEFDTSLSGKTIALTSGRLEIIDDLVISGLGADRLKIDAQGKSDVFKVYYRDYYEWVNVTIDGLSITGGGNTVYNPYEGFGITSIGKLTVSNSILSGNLKTGIYITTGSANVINSTISSNGTGIYNSCGMFTVTNSTISDNSDRGIFSDIYSGEIINSTISNNTTNGNGGGIYNKSGSQLTIINSTISGNTANGNGGGIYSTSYDTKIINSTITLNKALTNYGSGMAIGNLSQTRVSNTIISGNHNSDVDLVDFEAEITSGGGNLIGNGNAINAFNQPKDQINITNPGLAPLANNGGVTKTHLPLSNSPAIDAGNKQLLPQDTSDLDKDGNKTEPIPFDQRGVGFTRVFGSELDIGAVELQSQPTQSTTVSVTVSPTSVIENGTTNLIYTFKRTGNISSTLSNVKFNVSGTATFNNDYTQGGASSFSSTTGTLKFGANQDTKTITINPTGDTVIEPNETVKLTLVNGTDYKALSPTNATATIINDDNTVSVTVSPTSVIENGTTNLIYTFKRTGNISTALSNVKFNVSGTATFNNDYTQGGASSFGSTTGTLKFAANQDTKTITINPTGDTVIEPNETVKLTLVNGTDYKALSPTNATATIINDDVNSLLQHNSDLVALINPEVGGIFLA